MMEFFKRILLYVCLCLFASSVYQDLTINQQPDPQHHKHEIESNSQQSIIEVRVKAGDTVLSIVEHLNPSTHNRLNMERILTDFKLLNPGENPYQLQPGAYYVFPLYDYDS